MSYRDPLRHIAARVAIALAFIAAVADDAVAAQQLPNEAGILRELNLARTNPAEYARYVAQLLPHFDGAILRLPGEMGIRTVEGAAAVREAVAFLQAAQPLSALQASTALARAARDHVRDQGPGGRLGHVGTDGSDLGDRVSRYGTWLGSLSENIDYGSHTARRVVISLIVDDGVPGRGHRTNIFDAQARFAGIACGPHREYRVMCVIDFSENAVAPRR